MRQDWYNRANSSIPGGANSPVRAFGSVGGIPPFMVRGAASKITDEEGKSYIDYLCGWGSLILGHAHPSVVEAVADAAKKGVSFGASTPGEVLLAERIRSAIPSMQKIRLVNTGTEAAMTAIRLARAFSGRDKILKFEGCYHGHSDALLVKGGSGLLTFGIPSSAGVTAAAAADTVVAEYNHLDAVKRVFADHGHELACAIVEPVAGNMGLVPPVDEFLQTLSALCRKHGTVLIFDEVITGFRFHFGGYQNLCGIAPDLTCLGKVIGGGMPVAAVGGREEIMSLLAPLGPVYQAGTHSGNPVAVAAGLATLSVLAKQNPYPRLEKMGGRLCDGIAKIAEKSGLPITVTRIGSAFTPFFNPDPVFSHARATASNKERYAKYFNGLLDRGVYPPPSPFESWFVSSAHTEEDIDITLEKTELAFEEMKESLHV